MPSVVFRDRKEAGRLLGERLRARLHQRVVVLAVPRGGVPVAYEVALALRAPLDVVLAHKVGVPYQRELAVGAVGEGGVRVRNQPVMQAAGLSECDVEAAEAPARAMLEEQAARYRAVRPRVPVAGRTVVVVDDGIATGATVRAACEVARANGAARVVAAVPVAPPSSARALEHVADEVVCLEQPEGLFAVGQYYRDFAQVGDGTVLAILQRAAAGLTAGSASADPQLAGGYEAVLDASGAGLPANLFVPAGAAGVVLFAHGSGSSRHSVRNRAVAARLHAAGLATLLFDLLTPSEEACRSAVFDVALLADRLGAATDWVRGHPGLKGLPLGFFGASTGAAAALVAAATPADPVAAIVSRGGRPDLAGEALDRVSAPTLLIVGGHDRLVLQLNRQALARLPAPSRLEVVPGATHLFEEPGALERVADLAASWFARYLVAAAANMASAPPAC